MKSVNPLSEYDLMPYSKKKAQDGTTLPGRHNTPMETVNFDIVGVNEKLMPSSSHEQLHALLEGEKKKTNLRPLAQGLVSGLATLDSLLPEEKIQQPVVYPLESYNSATYGRGSQAIMESGGIIPGLTGTMYSRNTYKTKEKVSNKMMAVDGLTVDGGDPTSPEAVRKKYGKNKYVKGRESWSQMLNKNLGSTKTIDSVKNAAKLTKIDPALLYTSAMEEGMQLRLNDKTLNTSTAYDLASDQSKKGLSELYPNPFDKNKFPVDGFYYYGLDTFGDEYKNLQKKGYLPADFDKKFTTYKALNEEGERNKKAGKPFNYVNTAAFATDQDALTAKAAMLRNSQDYLDSYLKKSNLKLSDRQRDFFTLAGYNAGFGNLEKMIQSYNEKGYLKNDDFLNPNFKPASYQGVYDNVQRRLQNRNILKDQKLLYNGGNIEAKDGKWIQKAVNPKHKGYCTPMTKSTCTPKRKALAKTFKKHHGFHKKDDGGMIPYFEQGASYDLNDDQIRNLISQGYEIEIQ